MTAIFAIFILLIAAAGCFVGANFCEAPAAQQSLAGLGGALVGMILPNVPNALQALVSKPRNTQAGHATPALMLTGAFVIPALLIGLSLPSMSCKQVKPDVFFEAVVDCAKINPESSAASSAVLTCITGAISGNPAACLSGLVTEAHWTVDEVACIVADIAQRENKKVQLNGDPNALRARDTAVEWLRKEHINIRNSYPGAPQ